MSLVDPKAEWMETVYNAIVEDEDARVCKDISEEACSNVPANFVFLTFSKVLTKMGDALANPKTVLAWIMTLVQAPAFLVAFLVPIRESGSLLPQLLIAGFIRQMPKRKYAWVVGAFLQAIAVMGIGVVVWRFEGGVAGWLIIGCLVVFSLARGICSVSHKDVLGKTIPKTRRGRVSGLGASVSGFATMAVGLYLFWIKDEKEAIFYALLIGGAGLLWVMAGLVFALVQETPGETEGGGNAIVEGIQRLALLKEDAGFRRFVIARALALCSALTAPYYVVLGKEGSQAGASLLGAFILADGLASTVSSSFWGRFADVSSRKVLSLAVGMASLLGGIVFVIASALPVLHEWTWTYPVAFFFLGVAHSGVRLGRKTFVVDLAKGNRRTDYVSVSNTTIGAILLATGSLGALSSFASPGAIILVLSGFGLLGAILAWRLPEVT